MDEKNKYGLSKKTNVAIAAVTTISAAQNAPWAIAGIVVVALVSILAQYWIDRKKTGQRDE